MWAIPEDAYEEKTRLEVFLPFVPRIGELIAIGDHRYEVFRVKYRVDEEKTYIEPIILDVRHLGVGPA
jgi:hypothetical protein